MKHIALFSAAILFSAISVNEAKARGSGFFGGSWFGGGETIDLVYDLPETELFLRNGEAYDLGYLNSDNSSGYVLYRGERYSKLTEADIARLKAMLGFDPTTKDRMERAARSRDSSWTLAIVIAVAIIGIFVLVHKTIQIVRWMSQLSTTSGVTANKLQEEPPAPLDVRRARLAKRNRSDGVADQAARARADHAVAEAEPLPTRTGTTAQAFGRRNM